ncbi:MAG: spermidine/putrescine ABC transporter substrate-binding protein [Paludibacterium sp.]|uniref:ABC transporter substrate-binding protein n=1 Tax=Paludibacterium sp. TaxID=1917523 RepID=UPI0025DF5214|nr:spermidine/putrescine ABC transporter substrate-binding protein [Paludibacterium sp.]MBV8047372.1 spermidine/putrescine ABC transporter substrate-binding protein [Paludibacterium sp.]MBV8649109.1 spermidine/putrescine ABC transporter substrate-binding protein [Paludibacterium sp.]
MKKTAWLLCFFSLSSLAWSEPVLHLFSRHDFLPQSVIERFELHCHCQVEQVFYDDNEEMLARLNGGAEVDVVFPASFAVPELIRKKLLAPLDKSQLPNAASLNPLLANPGYDPGNVYSLPVSLSLAAVGYNIEKLRELNVDPYSWSAVFDPKVLAKLKGHVNVVDNPRTVFAAALMYLGLDPNSVNDDDYARAREVIAAARPYWSGFGGNYYWKDLVSGDAWVQLGFSPEFYQAREIAKREHRPYTIGYVLQREGNQLAIDDMAVPVSAPHPELAQRFINFLLAGKNAAELGNVYGATSAVSTAGPFFHEDIKYHPVINPDPGALRKWSVLREMTPKRLHRLHRMWHDLRSDRPPPEAPVVAPRKEAGPAALHKREK